MAYCTVYHTFFTNVQYLHSYQLGIEDKTYIILRNEQTKNLMKAWYAELNDGILSQIKREKIHFGKC